jgi:Domain of unknown function (DUF4926)
MIEEFEQVALTEDLSEFGLKAGDVGTVVDITPNDRQLTLEFFNFSGETVSVIPVKPEQVRRLAHNEVMHARLVKSA